MDIQAIGQKLLTELQEKLAADQNSAKLAEGAIQGVQLFYQRLTEAPEVAAAEVEVDSEKLKSGKKTKKG